ncbi:MAG: hypothetical protein ABR543_15920 [Gemmatimonadaceae bacterium]
MKSFNPPLKVIQLIATRAGDAERGPLVRLNGNEARLRLLLDGELAWVYGPRRHELAVVVVDDSLPRGTVALRDVAGASPSEIVHLVKTNTDRPLDSAHFG